MSTYEIRTGRPAVTALLLAAACLALSCDGALQALGGIDAGGGSAAAAKAPTLSHAAVDQGGATLVLTFSEALTGSAPPATAFTLAGTDATVTAVASSGATVTLTLSKPVTSGLALSIAFSFPSGSLAGSSGLAPAAASGFAVSNASIVPAGPKYPGFDFTLRQGDYWTYGWSYSSLSGFGSSSSNSSGEFTLSLGAPQDIGGIQAFPVTISGSPPAWARPRWTWLAMDDSRILGSVDGASLKTVFDAKTGLWKGGGFFRSLDDATFYAPGPASISNDYITDSSVLGIGSGFSSDTAFYVEGYGYFSTGEPDMSGSTQEYFKAGVGPVGYYNHFSYYDYYTQTSHTDQVGLIDSSIGSTLPPDFAAVYRYYYSSTGADNTISIGPGLSCRELDIFRGVTETDRSFTISSGQRSALYEAIVAEDGFRTDWHIAAVSGGGIIKTGGSASTTVALTRNGVTTTIPGSLDSTNYPEEAAAKAAVVAAIQALLPAR